MSSCQTIAKNHNGAIKVESKIDSGSTFTLYLPLSPSQKDISIIHQPFSTKVIRGSGRILYIEDDLNTQASIIEMLQELGYEVQYYSDLGSAIDYIKAHSDDFDIVITDFIIGDYLQGGIEILDNVRITRPHCPVILLTGYFEQLAQRTEQSHQFSYIAQKPVDFARMSQIINRYLKCDSDDSSDDIKL